MAETLTNYQQTLIQDWISEFNVNSDSKESIKFNKKSQYQKLKIICKNIRLVELIRYFSEFNSDDLKYGVGY